MHNNTLKMVCSCCKKLKTRNCFYEHPSIKPDGIRKKCNDCRNEYRRKTHLKNPKIKRDQSNKWNAKNKKKLALKAKLNRKLYPRRYKNYALKKDFGITIDQYEILTKKQNNVCCICKLPETNTHQDGRIRSLSVDHCHITGKVRGLLCWSCNTGIGKLKDSPDLLRTAANYIESNY